MIRCWKYIAAAATIATTLASCSEDDTTRYPEKDWGVLTAPSLTVSADEVSLEAGKADETALEFSWTAASVTRGASVVYDFYLNIEGNDLFKGVARDMGDRLTLSFTHSELNDLLVSTFGGRSGERFALRACVRARTEDYLVANTTSDEVAFSATTYAAEAVRPASVWMAGDACENGWDKAFELPRDERGVYMAEHVVLKFGKPDENKGFKFFVEQDGGYPFYGQRIDGEFGQIALFAIPNDGDSQFYPLRSGYTSGIYTVEVDLDAMQLALTRTGDVDEFDPSMALYLLGDNLENGWNMVEANALRPLGENIYQLENVPLQAESSFKFYFQDWTEFIRDADAAEYWTAKKKSDGDSDIRFIPGERGFVTGMYTVRVDLNTMQVVLTPTGTTGAYPDALFLFGPATEAGWELGRFIPMNALGNGLFRAEGVAIDVGTANPDDIKGNGFKFGVSNSEWSTEYGAKEAFDDVDGQPGYRGWELAQNGNQFYPLLMGFASGVYDITVDFGAMTVRFDPAGAAIYPEALYMLGDAMPGGWELGQAVAMTRTAPGIFVAERVPVRVGTAQAENPKGNGFKFIVSNTEWSTEYGAEGSFDEGYRGWKLVQSSNQFYPLLMGFADGDYRITADLTAMTVRFEAVP